MLSAHHFWNVCIYFLMSSLILAASLVFFRKKMLTFPSYSCVWRWQLMPSRSIHTNLGQISAKLIMCWQQSWRQSSCSYWYPKGSLQVYYPGSPNSSCYWPLYNCFPHLEHLDVVSSCDPRTPPSDEKELYSWPGKIRSTYNNLWGFPSWQEMYKRVGKASS